MFHCCFIKKHTNCKANSKPWLTKGIQTSCNRKRELYLKMRDNNEMKKLYYKEASKLNNEGKINSIRIKGQVVYNQITIANELNSYFSNIAGSISDKRINGKEGASPIQKLFKYFNQPFRDIRWLYTSAREIKK